MRRHAFPMSFRFGPAWLAAVLLLGGCAQADFGRQPRVFMGERPHDWVGEEAVGSIGLPASRFELTDDERQMRSLAYPLIAPPYSIPRWRSILAERGFIRPGPPDGIWKETVYWKKLVGEPHRSASSRYARLIEDARDDVVRLDLFFQTAMRVAEMDRVREKALTYIPDQSDPERANAFARLNENIATVDWVCRSAYSRLVSYRFALERMVIATPMPAAVDAERSLTLLETRLAYCSANNAALAAAQARPLISK